MCLRIENCGLGVWDFVNRVLKRPPVVLWSPGSLHCRPGCQKWGKLEADLAEPQGADLDHGCWGWCLRRVQVTRRRGSGGCQPGSLTQFHRRVAWGPSLGSRLSVVQEHTGQMKAGTPLRASNDSRATCPGHVLKPYVVKSDLIVWF